MSFPTDPNQPPQGSSSPEYLPQGTYAPPGAPSAAKGLAISALVVGCVAFFIGLLPFIGFLVGGTALVLGIIALAKKQSKGLAIPGVVLGALAALTSLIVTIAMFASSSRLEEGFRSGYESTQNSSENSSTTPSSPPSPDTEDSPEAEPEPSAEPDATAENKDPEHGTLDDKQFQILMKDPDARNGERVTLFASVAQFDSATGPCSFLADIGPAQGTTLWEYERRAQIDAPSPVCEELANVVEGDHLKLEVTVLGSITYSNTMGGGNTVAHFKLDSLATLKPLEDY